MSNVEDFCSFRVSAITDTILTIVRTGTGKYPLHSKEDFIERIQLSICLLEGGFGDVDKSNITSNFKQFNALCITGKALNLGNLVDSLATHLKQFKPTGE